MTDERKELGLRGEDAACEYLEQKRKLKVLDRNWRCGYGEADIIALDKDTLVFCEVKTRRSLKAGIPEASITRQKQQRYYKLAQVYRSRCSIRHKRVRFDVIAIHAPQHMQQAHLRYYRGAFKSDLR